MKLENRAYSELITYAENYFIECQIVSHRQDQQYHVGLKNTFMFVFSSLKIYRRVLMYVWFAVEVQLCSHGARLEILRFQAAYCSQDSWSHGTKTVYRCRQYFLALSSKLFLPAIELVCSNKIN